MAKIWTTKDGRKIKYKDLEDDHLLNILKMLISNAQTSLSADNVLMFLGPEPPDDVADQQFDLTWDDYLHDSYYDLETEYMKRNLDMSLIEDHGNEVANRGLTFELKALTKSLKGKQ